ncbi:MAG: hypothetical protein JWN04_2 [Myxococcaceae bacterium]|nr:hypothetical protein [Myxococcaceae bacterium]
MRSSWWITTACIGLLLTNIGCNEEQGNGQGDGQVSGTVTNIAGDHSYVAVDIAVSFDATDDLKRHSPPDGASFVLNNARAAIATASADFAGSAIVQQPTILEPTAQTALAGLLGSFVYNVHIDVRGARLVTEGASTATNAPSATDASVRDAGREASPDAATGELEPNVDGELPSPIEISTSRPECGFEPQLTQLKLSQQSAVTVSGSGATLGFGSSDGDLTILPCTLRDDVAFTGSFYPVIATPQSDIPATDPFFMNPSPVPLSHVVPLPGGKEALMVKASPAANLRGSVIFAMKMADGVETVALRDGAWVVIPSEVRTRKLDSKHSETVLTVSVPLTETMIVGVRTKQ